MMNSPGYRTELAPLEVIAKLPVANAPLPLIQQPAAVSHPFSNNSVKDCSLSEPNTDPKPTASQQNTYSPRALTTDSQILRLLHVQFTSVGEYSDVVQLTLTGSCLLTSWRYRWTSPRSPRQASDSPASTPPTNYRWFIPAFPPLGLSLMVALPLYLARQLQSFEDHGVTQSNPTLAQLLNQRCNRWDQPELFCLDQDA